MPPIHICPGCEQSLTTASDAIGHHADDMRAAISLIPSALTEDQIDQYKIRLIASFNEAQSAWHAYCDHLREHGIFPVIAPPKHS